MSTGMTEVADKLNCSPIISLVLMVPGAEIDLAVLLTGILCPCT